MDTVRKPGAGIGREIATGEAAESQIDSFISKRHEQRRRSEGDAAAEDLWKAAERREADRRRRENRAGWYGWHMRRAELYGQMSREHEAAAEMLMGGPAA